MTGNASPKLLTMLRRFPVPPERVFAAWTDPELVAMWLFGGPTSEAHETSLDVRIGGRWQISDTREGTKYTALGEYLEIDPPHRLAFTFAMPQFSPDADTITVVLEPAAEGTLMTFTQAGPGISEELGKLTPGRRSATETGWHFMFLGLADVVEGRQPPMPPSHTTE